MATTLYQVDNQRIYTGVTRVSENGARKENEVRTPPPDTSGEEVAQWRGGSWFILPSRPEVPSLPIEQLRKIKLNEVTEIRKRVEQGGIIFNGANIGTDKEDQSAINSVLNVLTLAQSDPDYPSAIDFKAGDTFVQIDFSVASAISKAVANHVQSCFTAEKAHYEAIALLEDSESIKNYDIESGWPI